QYSTSLRPTSFQGESYTLASSRFPDCGGRAFIVDRRFQDEWEISQFRMSQHAAECVFSDVILTDILMVVGARAERGFGIVGVDQFHVGHAEDAVGVADGPGESGSAADIVACGEQVAGVEAIADGQIAGGGRQVTYGAELFKAGADVTSAARRAFDQQHRAAAG